MLVPEGGKLDSAAAADWQRTCWAPTTTWKMSWCCHCRGCCLTSGACGCRGPRTGSRRASRSKRRTAGAGAAEPACT